MIIIGGIFFAVIAAGFFAGIETGLLAADQLSLFSKKEDGIFYAVSAHFLLIKPERLLSTTLIGTNISMICAAVLLKSLLTEYGLPVWITWLGSLGLSMILLVFSEIVPKSFFREHSDTVSVRCAPVLVFFYFLFLPFSVLFNGIVKLFLLVLGQKSIKRLPRSREDLKLLIKLINKESGIEQNNQRFIDDLFDFKETMAREVMTPFHEVPVININRRIDDVLEICGKERTRYLAVFAGRADNVIGYIDVKDLLKIRAKSIGEILKKAYFYPDTKHIPELLRAMIERKQDVVFLSDEYGGISGEISRDDIASDIVGFMPREESKKEKEIKKINKNTYHISGTTDLEDLYNETGIRIEKGVYDTIGGYICTKMGEIPEKGAIFKDKTICFTIIDRDDRHIIRIEMQKIKRDEASSLE